MLKPSRTELSSLYDLIMLDLDGVVYIGPRAVPGAPEHLGRARDAGAHLAFVTNNAARPPEAVADHLTRLGVMADAADVVTSAQAAARLLTELVRPGAPVLLMGGPGVELALHERGFEPVTELEGHPEAVVSGYGPDLMWKQLMLGAVQIRDGLPWVASNADMTIPTDYGIGPGHGVVVKMLRDFSGKTPAIAGKPERPLLDETVSRVGGEHPLMVGDRLDTDILGAHNADVDSLLVLTGVTGLGELVAAKPEERPTYLASDLAGLLQVHPDVEQSGDTWAVGGWQGTVQDGALVITGQGSIDDWWRCVASVAWDHHDRRGQVVETAGLAPGMSAATSQGR
ncbi:Hydrolase [metagenome]|uniref:Hydrolase n=1 Tax=metagenome TaxID=256318 RepID=A0A2P2CAP5_9ZZZZ